MMRLDVSRASEFLLGGKAMPDSQLMPRGEVLLVNTTQPFPSLYAPCQHGHLSTQRAFNVLRAGNTRSTVPPSGRKVL